MAVVNSLAHKPFYLTLQGENGKPIPLENTIYLQGEWEVCLSQMYYTKNSNSLYKDSYIRILILPVEKKVDQEEALAWNNMLKTKSQRFDVTIRFPAGQYQGDSLVQTLNKALCEQEQLKTYYERTQYALSNGQQAPHRKCPEFRDSQGRTMFWCNQDDVKYVEMNRELAFVLGFVAHAKHGPEHVPIVENAEFGPKQVLSSNPRPPNGGIFYYFVYLDIIEFQTIGDITSPLLRIVPVMNQDEIVHEIQFDRLYYFPVQTKAFNQLIPNVRSEFGEEILFRSSDPLYVLHFRPKSI